MTLRDMPASYENRNPSSSPRDRRMLARATAMRVAAAIVVALTAFVLVPGSAAAERERDGDRRDRRSGELALPDPYLDPAWPDESSFGPGPAMPVIPEESDSVEHVPNPDEAADRAEQEEMQRYKEALGLPTGPDDFTQDHWDEERPAGEGEGQGENDPAEW